MKNNIKYETKTVMLKHRGETVERTVKADLDRVYVGGTGETFVYYDANTMIDDKHLFVLGDSDNLVEKMKDKLV